MSDSENNRRMQRFEKEIRLLVSQFFSAAVKDEYPEWLWTVSRVAVTGDLRAAKVFVSRFSAGDQERPELSASEKERVQKQLQIEFTRHWSSKFTPRLTLILDKLDTKLVRFGEGRIS